MKNRLLLLIILSATAFSIFAQGSQRKHFSPEIKISYNLQINTLFGGNGFGVSVHNAFFNQNRFNLVVGLEYNAVFFKIYFLESDFVPQLHFVGIPVNARVNFGKNVKFFIEAGVFFDPVVLEKQIFLEKENSKTEKTVYMYKPDFGLSGGIGLRIPVKKYELLIKSDYKWGMGSLVQFCPAARYNKYWRFAVGFKI